MTRWFTSDTHIGHRLVAGLRGFHLPDGEPDIEAHADTVAANWDRVVRKDDTVYVLGDIAMNAKPEVFEWFDARPGRKVLIAGNHDSVHPMHSSALKDFPKWAPHFAMITPFLRVKVDARTVLLSHFPYSGEGSRPGPDRYPEYRLRDEGLPLLCGHTHENTTTYGTHTYHVGLDAHELQLVSEAQVTAWLKTVP